MLHCFVWGEKRSSSSSILAYNLRAGDVVGYVWNLLVVLMQVKYQFSEVVTSALAHIVN